MIQEKVPDVALINILSYLPPQSFLPVSHVSKRFKEVWVQFKSAKTNGNGLDCDFNETNPLALGQLFESSWHSCVRTKSSEKNKLRQNLLVYFVKNGYGKPNVDQKCQILRRVMLEAASRGDIDGMWFMVCKGYCNLDDKEICTMAGAAGHLEALRWLRGEKVESFNMDSEKSNICCPWDPTDVHREAAENLHDDVMEYVEKNCKDHEIHMHYGVGLPW